MRCPNCGQVLPESVAYCAYCGQAVTSVRQAFTFSSGEKAHTPEQLVPLCQRHWDDAEAYLYGDQGFRAWFIQSHRNDLVRIVDRCRQEENPSMGLDKFIRSLDPDLQPPEVKVRAYNNRSQHFDFLHSDPPDMGVEVHNRGPGCCYGRLRVSNAKWIAPSSSAFAVPPGRKQRIRLDIDPRELVWETTHTARVIVETNGRDGKTTAMDFSLSTPRHPAVERVRLLREEGKWRTALEELEELQEGAQARQLRNSILSRRNQFYALLAIGDALLYGVVGAVLAHASGANASTYFLGGLILGPVGAVGYSVKFAGRHGYLADCTLGALAPLAIAVALVVLYVSIGIIIALIMLAVILAIVAGLLGG